jgi:two-component system chemotaxis response regulator CheB
MNGNKIRVLIAEDSPTARQLLVSMLDDDPSIDVVGVVGDGEAAIERTVELAPDVVVMDIHMPGVDGIDATKRIMVDAPTPVVIVTSVEDPADVRVSMNALRAGALTLVRKPEGPASANFERERTSFLRTVKAMAEVKVVRHRAALRDSTRELPPPAQATRRAIDLVAIAASTGGPAALQQLVTRLPQDFGVPIVVVQHIAAGFVGGLAAWLESMGNLRVKVAEDGERLEGGVVYVAPDGCHLGVIKGRRARLEKGAPIGGFRPSATHLFSSVAAVCGDRALAVILTGMGEDGVAGLVELRGRGGYVIAQDERTSVVYGMPGAASAASAVDKVLPLEAIASTIVEMVS